MLPSLSFSLSSVFFFLLGEVILTPVVGLVIPNLDKRGTDSFCVEAVIVTIAEHITSAFSCCNILEWIYS